MWGYDLQKFNRNDELTEIVVDAPQSVRDQTTGAQDATPIESQRLWERQAEENTIERLQKIGLVAPSRSEEHTSELQSLTNLVCRLLLEKKKDKEGRP